MIGAGFSGIGAGIKLKAAGIDDFVILERATDVGGTWRDNSYPGLAVDVTALTYSYSFEPNPDWSRLYAPRDELKAYADHCVRRYDLGRHLCLGTTVQRLVFDPAAHVWSIHTLASGTIRARFVINATGGLIQPKPPDIPGLDDFAGKAMHTARWDHDHDLRGERVGVIGTGATAVQLVPEIAEVAERLHVFQRTPIWVFPKFDHVFSRRAKWLFRRVPLTQRALRLVAGVLTELAMVLGVVHNRQFPALRTQAEKVCRAHLKRQVPDPELRRRLLPGYPLGCKRPTFSNEYLASFVRDDVELVTAGIERITARGVRTCDGRDIELDTLVLATGYKVFERDNLPPFPVVGLGGVELGRFWDEQRYQAYEGASVPQFPNFWLVLGPYSFTGASWFSMIEAHTTHALRCILEAQRRDATLVAVRQEVHDEYFADILRRQRNTVFFNNNCAAANSYYFDRHGDAPFVRPSSGLEMWWRSRTFPVRNYRFERAT